MGISIHYAGSIAEMHKLQLLIEEVQEIANVHGWEYHVYEREFPIVSEVNSQYDSLIEDYTHNGNLYGIDFTPEGGEPIPICFLSNGRMSSIMQLALWGNFEKESITIIESEEWNENGEYSSSVEELILDQNKYNQMLYSCSSKTQFAGSHIHELVIGVLRYISNTYLNDFKLTDEGQFWETSDTILLQQNFDKNGYLINSFKTKLVNEKRMPDEDVDSFIRRIVKGIRNSPSEE